MSLQSRSRLARVTQAQIWGGTSCFLWLPGLGKAVTPLVSGVTTQMSRRFSSKTLCNWLKQINWQLNAPITIKKWFSEFRTGGSAGAPARGQVCKVTVKYIWTVPSWGKRWLRGTSWWPTAVWDKWVVWWWTDELFSEERVEGKWNPADVLLACRTASAGQRTEINTLES